MLISKNVHGQAAQHRLTRRIHQLLQFHATNERMPLATTRDHYERGLFLFMTTLRERHRDGLLAEEHVLALRQFPGLLEETREQVARTRDDLFIQWLTRVERFVKDNGFRPGCAQENDLYQWTVRARRRLDAGQLDEITARRLQAVLDAPDRRRYRAMARLNTPAAIAI